MSLPIFFLFHHIFNNTNKWAYIFISLLSIFHHCPFLSFLYTPKIFKVSVPLLNEDVFSAHVIFLDNISTEFLVENTITVMHFFASGGNPYIALALRCQ